MPTLWQYIRIKTGSASSLDQAKQRFQRCRFPFLSFHIRSVAQAQSQFISLLTGPENIQPRGVKFTSDYGLQALPVILEMCNKTELEEIVIYEHALLEDLPVPNLKRLFIHTIPNSWLTTPPPPKLTALVVTKPVHWTLLQYILANSPCLQRAMLWVAESGKTFSGLASESPSSKSGLHLLPYLLSFGIVSESEEDLPLDLLRNFSLPVLHSFEYYTGRKDHQWMVWPTSLGLLSGVRRLTIQSHSQALIEIFEATPVLEELRISWNSYDLPGVFQPLIDLPSSDPQRSILLRLKVLQLSWESWQIGIQDAAPQLRQLAQAWSTPTPGRPNPITHFKLVFCNREHHRAKRLWDAIVQDGPLDLDLEVICDLQWGSVHIPIACETYEFLFTEVKRRAVLQGDGTWKVRYAPAY
ncbi:hypothetical protein BDN72DRAFT_392071 [Pluteus cervinus]|uniref:Uncharacterized protein n=1 Tax=Pluteus cervinus TaxID=181527 RepID=A0ACD3A9L6_9AGAR|nr:hypothetical protein BDN72DRAFT_392071 [Pluteus cervinus]